MDWRGAEPRGPVELPEEHGGQTGANGNGSFFNGLFGGNGLGGFS